MDSSGLFMCTDTVFQNQIRFLSFFVVCSFFSISFVLFPFRLRCMLFFFFSSSYNLNHFDLFAWRVYIVFMLGCVLSYSFCVSFLLLYILFYSARIIWIFFLFISVQKTWYIYSALFPFHVYSLSFGKPANHIGMYHTSSNRNIYVRFFFFLFIVVTQSVVFILWFILNNSSSSSSSFSLCVPFFRMVPYYLPYFIRCKIIFLAKL